MAMLVIAATAIFAVVAEAAPRSFYGVSSQTPLEPREFDRMGKGKLGTVRALLSWGAIDPSPAADDYNWSGFDFLVANAARNRIRILPFIFSSPEWVVKGLDGRNCGSDCPIYAPRRKAALAAWKRFVGDAVDRYGRKGEFWSLNPDLPRRPIKAWQIWNEQNSKSFYRPRPNVKGYAKLLDRAAKAISSRDRRADLVLGGMPELAGSRKAVAGSKYLRKLYRRKGVERDFDGIAPHPYSKRFKSVREQVEGFRRQAERAGDRRVDLWITETGWGSARKGNPLNVGKRGQAKRLKQTYRYFERNRKRLNVKSVTWFSWRDSREQICDWCPTSGLFSKSLTPKPSWRALTMLTGGR